MSVETYNHFQREEGEPEIPTCWEICPRCRGNGELGGYPGVFTEADFETAEDLDDYRQYRRTCEDCGGSGKVRAVDYTRASHDQLDDFYEYAREIAEMNAIEAQERRMGA
jgi:hypothetical protein